MAGHKKRNLKPRQRKAFFAQLDKDIQLQYRAKKPKKKIALGRTSNWTKGDTIKQGILSGLIIGDWAQTKYIANDAKQYNADPIRFKQSKNRGPYYEANPITQKIIGKNPRGQDVDLYFGLSLILSALIAKKLSPKMRKLFQSISIAMRANTVLKNKQIGIGFKF